MPSQSAIWARVSTDEQEPGSQLAELRQWAGRRGREIATKYVIDGGRASRSFT
jgi:DNA invertase Pin-like site-specific DNA recombinase